MGMNRLPKTAVEIASIESVIVVEGLAAKALVSIAIKMEDGTTGIE